jgi:hypothetical protein
MRIGRSVLRIRQVVLQDLCPEAGEVPGAIVARRSTLSY